MPRRSSDGTQGSGRAQPALELSHHHLHIHVHLTWVSHKPQHSQPSPATPQQRLEKVENSASLTSACKPLLAKEPPRSDQTGVILLTAKFP